MAVQVASNQFRQRLDGLIRVLAHRKQLHAAPAVYTGRQQLHDALCIDLLAATRKVT